MGFRLSYLFLVVLSFLMIVSTSMSATLSRSLSQGWNLVQIPVSSNTQVSTFLTGALADGTQTVTKIWTYDGQWYSWTNSTDESADNTTLNNAGQFKEFTSNRSYWFLMSSATTLSVDDATFDTTALTLNTNGWALASFNQETELSIATQVLTTATVDSNHAPTDIKRIWEFKDNNWASYVSASGSGALSTIKPLYGYWFLAQNASAQSPLTITPAGATANDAVLIIGGATTLFPPNATQAAQLLGRPLTLSKYSASRFSTVAAAATTGVDNMSCTNANDEGKVVGVAWAISAAGTALTSAEVKCPSNPATTPVSFQLGFNKTQAQNLKDNPALGRDMFIKVEMNSGQVQKTCIPASANPAIALAGVDVNAVTSPVGSQTANTSSTSTLAAAMVSLEAAKKLGVSPEQFKFGEINAGLTQQNSNVNTIISSTAASGVDITSMMGSVMDGVNSGSPLFSALKDKIESVNNPAMLAQSGRDFDKGQEVANIIAGKSIDSRSTTGAASFKTQLDAAKKMNARLSEIITVGRNAARKGAANSSQRASLEMIKNKMLMVQAGKENLLDVAQVVTKSLNMATLTSGDAAVGGIAQSKAASLLASATAAVGALDSTSGTTQAMTLIASGLEFPSNVVKTLAKNSSAAKEFAGIIGMGSRLQKRAESEDNSATSTSGRKLDKLGNITSKLSNSTALLATLAENATDTNAVSQIIGGAINATAGATDAAKVIFSKISEVTTKLSTDANKSVDFADIMKQNKKDVEDPASFAKFLAKNSGSASNASAILGSVASSLTTEELNDVLTDETIAQEFSLGSAIFADAGGEKRIKYSGTSVVVNLDGRNSFDPSGSTLSFQWFSIDTNGTASEINTTASTAYALTTVAVDTAAGGRIAKTYRVSVTNAAGKKASADVNVLLFSELPPEILAPRYLVARAGRALRVNAADSFDPEGDAPLTFNWNFASAGVTLDQARGELTFTNAGTYDGVLTVSKASGSSSTQAITVKVNGAQPPIADAGYDLVLSAAEMTDLISDLGGLPMDNYSFSFETGDESGLTYSWSPASYFSRAAGQNTSSAHPLFIVTKSGTYDITLNVTDTNNNQTASDSVKIIVRRGQPPFADAGGVRVVRLGSGDPIYLDGSFSFSFVTDSPTYSWTGPTSFVGSSASSAVAQIQLDPANFTKKQRLEYTLTVTDNNGSATDTATVVVVPSVLPPVPVVDAFPRLPFYRGGDVVDLDAGFSFSPDGKALTYSWNILGNATISAGSRSDSFIELTLPSVSNDTTVKAQLTVTDADGKAATQEVSFNVRAEKRPPVAFADPGFIVLEDGGASIRVNAFDSFSPTGNALSYSWQIDSTKVSLAAGSSTSSPVIELSAKTGVSNSFSNITLTVTDESNGLSDTFLVVAQLKKSRSAAQPIFLEGEVETTFDFTNRRFKPVFARGNFFPSGKSYAYDEAGAFVYEKGDQISVNGFGYDPNPTPVAYTAVASLYVWNPSTESFTGSPVETSLLANSQDGFVDFSYSSSALTTASTWFALEVKAGSGDRMKAVTIPFQVRPETVASQPIAKAIIKTIESPSVGTVTVETSTYTNKFPDDGVFVRVSGETSTNPNGGGLKYEWTASFEQTAKEAAAVSPPQLFFNGRNKPVLEFFWPLKSAAIKLKVNLKVYDEFSNTPSKTSQVTLTLNQATAIPPVADPGIYPPLRAPRDTAVPVVLDASASFSPVGNDITYAWKYLGFADNVFDSSNEATGVNATANLAPGKHPFTLTVTDANDRTLKNSKFFTINIEEEKVIADGTEFEVDGFVDAFPIDARVGQNVEIVADAFAFDLNPGVGEEFDFAKMQANLTIRRKDASLGSGFSTTGAASSGLSTSFSTPGEYIVNYLAWHDTNQNGSFNPLQDQSDRFSRRFIIRVREDVKPIRANVQVLPKIRQVAGAATIPVTFTVNNPNGAGWTYNYRYEISDSNNFERVVSFDSSLSGSTNSVSGSEKITGSNSNQLTGVITNLPKGEYFLSLEVRAEKGDVVLDDFNDAFIRIVSSDVNVVVEIIDPASELNLDAVSVKVYAVTSVTANLNGDLIHVAGVGGAPLTTLESTIRSFELTFSSRFDFGSFNPAHGQTMATAAGRHKITGLLIQVEDPNARGDDKVRISEFRQDAPEDGDWYIDLIKRSGNVDIEGTFLSIGDSFSFQTDEVVINIEDEFGNEREDIDLIVGEDQKFVASEADETILTSVNSPFFKGSTDRRVIPVFPFSSDGSEVTAEDFFDRALSARANITFSQDLFDNTIDGAIFPEDDDMFIIEYPREDGKSGYALILVTYNDEFGFAFRYAKATQTIPEISFAGSTVKDQIRMTLDFDTGEFFAEGGIPNTEFFVVTSSNKGYIVSGTGNTVPTSDCTIFSNIDTPFTINHTCVGKFNNNGRVRGYLEFREDFFPEPGDAIDIVGYTYEDKLGNERNIDLPNPFKFIVKDDKFGGFGLAYTRVTTDNEFMLYYFGEANMGSLLNSSNFMVKVSSAHNPMLFTSMAAGNTAITSMESMGQVQTLDGEMLGAVKVTLGTNVFSTANYLGVWATTAVVSLEGDPVERRVHVVTEQPLWGSLINPPHPDTKLLQVKEDDYGFRSTPYLVKTTINANGVTYIEGNPYGNFNDYRQFLAVDYSNGIRYMGIGDFDSFSNTRNFWEIPQTAAGYNAFTNSAPRAMVKWLTTSATVGDSMTGTYQMGNSFNQAGGSNVEFGEDFRPKVDYAVTVLRVRPSVNLGSDEYPFRRNAVEVRVTEKILFPEYDEFGQATGNFSTQHFELKNRRFWFLDGIGFARQVSETRFVDTNNTEFIDHGKRESDQVVAFKLGGVQAPPVVFDGDVSLIDPDFTGFSEVDLIVELNGGAASNLYKVVLLKPSAESTTGVTRATDVDAAMNTPENFNNKIPSFSDVSVTLSSFTTDGEYILRVYGANAAIATTSGIAETEANLAAEKPFRISGKFEQVVIPVELRGEGETLAKHVRSFEGFSLLAGEHVGEFDPKRDFTYVFQDFGNDLEVRLNPFLPDDMTPAGRRIKEVFVEGNDIKAKFESLINGTAQIPSAGLTGAADRVVVQPGKTYLYYGPGVDSMKQVGQDRVIALIGVTKKTPDEMGFVYLLKPVNELKQFVKFENLAVNSNLGFKVQENKFAERVRIQGFYDPQPGTTSLVFNAIGDTMSVQDALANPQSGLTTHVWLNITQSGVYSLRAGSTITNIRKLKNDLDIFSLPSALPTGMLTNSTLSSAVSSSTTFERPNTFLMTDQYNNHILLKLGSYFDFAANAQRYYGDSIYLMDGTTAVPRFWVYYNMETNQVEVDQDPQALQPNYRPLLDFGVTGQEFQEITDAGQALLTIEGDRFLGDFSVFAKDPSKSDLLRGAIVKAVFEFDDGVSAIELDSFDGTGHREVSKAQATQGVELGALDFGGFLNGNLRFKFNDDPSRHSGDKVIVKQLQWSLPGSTTNLTTSVNVVFEFNEGGGVQTPAPGQGFQIIGAKTGIDGIDPYVDVVFSKDLDSSSVEFPYLVRLEKRMNSMMAPGGLDCMDPINASAPECMDPTMDPNSDGTMNMEPQFFSPIELVIQAPQVLRAYFPANSAEAIALNTSALFDLFVDTDFGSAVPRGIKAADGELMNFGYMSVGNRPIFPGNMFFNWNESNEFVFFRFGDNLSADQNPIVTATMRAAMNTSNVVSLDSNGTPDDRLTKRFKIESGSFKYCGNSTSAMNCTTLWRGNSTVGSVIPDGAGGYATIRDQMEYFYTGGMEFINAVAIDMVRRTQDTIAVHKLVFANNVGLVNHSVDLIERGTFNFKGFNGVELVGFKIGSEQRGNLQGLSGIQFQGIDIDLDFIPGNTMTGPYTMTFFQSRNNTESALAYSLDQGSTFTTAPLDVVAGNITPVFFPSRAAAPDNMGIAPSSTGDYTLVAKLTDSSGTTEVRNVPLNKFQQFFYWFIDFAQSGGGFGINLHAGEYYSMLRGVYEFQESAKWDLKLDAASNGLTLLVKGQSVDSNLSAKIRRVKDEGSFEDALSLPGHRITTNGLSGQTGENTLAQESLLARPGQLYLVQIPVADRKKALDNNDLTKGVWVLILVKDVDDFGDKIEFDYVISDTTDDFGVDFNFRPVNTPDSEFTGGGFGPGGGGAAPSLNGFMQLRSGDCADLDLDPFDPTTGFFDDFRAVNGCEPTSANVIVEGIEFTQPQADQNNPNRVRAELDVEITIPGGYKNSPFKTFDLYILPFAVHNSMLVDGQGQSPVQTSLIFRQPVEVEYFDGTCNAFMPFFERPFFGRDADNGNDFMFQFSLFVDASGFDPNAIDPNSQQNTSLPTSVNDCLSQVRPILDVNYLYFDHTDSVPHIDNLALRGDFNGTNRPHPMNAMGISSLEQLANFGPVGFVPLQPDGTVLTAEFGNNKSYFSYFFEDRKVIRDDYVFNADNTLVVQSSDTSGPETGTWELTSENDILITIGSDDSWKFTMVNSTDNPDLIQLVLTETDGSNDTEPVRFHSTAAARDAEMAQIDPNEILVSAWAKAVSQVSVTVTVAADFGQRFQLATYDRIYDGFGTAVSFEVSGINPNVPLRYVMEAFGPGGFRQQEFTTSTAWFNTGQFVVFDDMPIGDGFTNDPTGGTGTLDCTDPINQSFPECSGGGEPLLGENQDHSNMPALVIDFQPFSFGALPFTTMTVNELQLSVPFSNLSTRVQRNASLSFGDDFGGGGFVDCMMFPNDPSCQGGGGGGMGFMFDPQMAMPFTTGDISGMTFYSVRENDLSTADITFDAITGIPGTQVTVNETDQGIPVSSQLVFEVTTDGTLRVGMGSGSVTNIYKVTMAAGGIVVATQDDGSMEWDREIWFQSPSEVDFFNQNGGFSQIPTDNGGNNGGVDCQMFPNDTECQGNGGNSGGGNVGPDCNANPSDPACQQTSGPAPMMGAVQPSFRLLGARPGSASQPMEVSFSKDIPVEAVSNFGPTAVADITSAADMVELTSVFGPWKFLIFRDLSAGDFFELSSLTTEDPQFFTRFTDLLSRINMKVVDITGGGQSYVAAQVMDQSNNPIPNRIAIGDQNSNNAGIDTPIHTGNLTIYFSPFSKVNGQNLEGLMGISGQVDLNEYFHFETSGIRWVEQYAHTLGDFFNPGTGYFDAIANNMNYKVVKSIDRSELPTQLMTQFDQFGPENMNFKGESLSATNLVTQLIASAGFWQGLQSPGQLEGVELLWKIPTSGSLLSIADFEMGEDHGFYNQRGLTQQSPGVLMNLAEGILPKSGPNGVGGNGSLQNIGEWVSQEYIGWVTDVNGTFYGSQYFQTVEYMGKVFSVTVNADGNTTDYTNVLVVRSTEWTKPVSSLSMSGPWNDNESGFFEFNQGIALVVPGVGPIAFQDEQWSIDTYQGGNTTSTPQVEYSSDASLVVANRVFNSSKLSEVTSFPEILPPMGDQTSGAANWQTFMFMPGSNGTEFTIEFDDVPGAANYSFILAEQAGVQPGMTELPGYLEFLNESVTPAQSNGRSEFLFTLPGDKTGVQFFIKVIPFDGLNNPLQAQASPELTYTVQ